MIITCCLCCGVSSFSPQGRPSSNQQLTFLMESGVLNSPPRTQPMPSVMASTPPQHGANGISKDQTDYAMSRSPVAQPSFTSPSGNQTFTPVSQYVEEHQSPNSGNWALPNDQVSHEIHPVENGSGAPNDDHAMVLSPPAPPTSGFVPRSAPRLRCRPLPPELMNSAWQSQPEQTSPAVATTNPALSPDHFNLQSGGTESVMAQQVEQPPWSSAQPFSGGSPGSFPAFHPAMSSAIPEQVHAPTDVSKNWQFWQTPEGRSPEQTSLRSEASLS